MQSNFYWLLSITSESARVSLVSFNPSSSEVKSLGPETAWDPALPDSLIRAVDTSLTTAATDYKLPADSEPDDCAFIIPPLWVDPDGRIFPDLLKNLESLCRELKFHPLGFISQDDAFVESYRSTDSFPGSYILLHLQSAHFQLSLVYLGSIKKRISENFEGEFFVKLLEDTLININFLKALPPKIIIIGGFTNSLVEDIKNYNWTGTPNTETFLHLPDVVTIDAPDLQQLFSQTIQHQLSPLGPPKSSGSEDEGGPIEPEEPSPTELDPPLPPPTLVEASDLGFSENISKPIIETESNFVEIPHPFSKPHPRYFWIFPFILLLLLIPIAPLFFAKAEITLLFTPTEFTDTFSLTIDPTTPSINNSLVPVSQKKLTLSVTSSIPASGKKEIGEKSRGEVIIFNKLDTIQNAAKGIIFSDKSGHKFELNNNLQIPGSTYNLDSGIITLGQAKTTLVAIDIGPESNLPAGTQLSSSNPNFLIKINSNFSGGTKELVAVVSAQDRSRLLETARQELSVKAKNQIQTESVPGLTIFDSTAFFDNQRTDYNREIGEVTDSLTLNLSSQVSFLFVDTTAKSKIVSHFLQNNPKISGLDQNSLTIGLSFIPKDLTSTKASGSLTIFGKGNPQIDTAVLRRRLAFKSDNEIKKIVSVLPNFYNYSVKNNLKFINLFNRLPRNPDSITVITKY
jgi:hypothetical protein